MAYGLRKGKVDRGPCPDLLGHATSIHLKHFDRALPKQRDESHQLPLVSTSVCASLVLASLISFAALGEDCAKPYGAR